MYVEKYAGITSDLGVFAYYSQVMQAFAIKTAIEALRFSKYCKGSLYWQLNDVWPVSSWATVDCYGIYKAAHYTARLSYQPVYLGIILQNNTYQLLISNQYTKSVSGSLKYTIFDFSGRVLRNTTTKGFLISSNRLVLSA